MTEKISDGHQDDTLTPKESARLDTLMDTSGKTVAEAWRIVESERRPSSIEDEVSAAAQRVVGEEKSSKQHQTADEKRLPQARLIQEGIEADIQERKAKDAEAEERRHNERLQLLRDTDPQRIGSVPENSGQSDRVE